MIYGSCDMKCDRQNFFVILNSFLPFYPSNNPKNQNFEKLKKTPGDVIILHKCTKNHDNMLYCSLHIVHNGLEISSFYIHVPKIMIRCMVPEIWSMMDRIFCHFAQFFALQALTWRAGNSLHPCYHLCKPGKRRLAWAMKSLP